MPWVPKAGAIELEECGAGRYAFFGGRWSEPCNEPLRGRIHVIGSDHGVEMRFCDKHFRELLKAGLVEEPYISPEGFEKLTGRKVR